MRYTLILAASLAFAGQSLIPSASNNGSATTPTRALGDAYVIEFYVHNIGTWSANFGVVVDNSADFGIQYDSSAGTTLWVLTNGTADTGSSGPCVIVPATYPNGVLARFHRRVSGTAVTTYLELWSADGTGSRTICTQTATASSGTATGTTTMSAGAPVRFGFFRRITGEVALNGRPPVPADTGTYVYHWKFEGDLTDSSGNGRNFSMTGSTFAASPAVAIKAQFLAGPAVATLNGEGIASIPCRAGHPCTLTSTSWTTGDSVPTPASLFWQQISGPRTLRFSSRSAANVTVTGCTNQWPLPADPVASKYAVRLVATDSGVTASTDLEIGCIATDSNGIVVFPDTKLDNLLGPTIAFGRNPWTWADERQWTGHSIRVADITSRWMDADTGLPGFASWKAGTVAWDRDGSTCATTLAAELLPAATSVSVVDASVCDWSTLPVIVEIGGGLFNDWLWITGRSGNTLTVGAYGRNLSGVNATYPAGTTVNVNRLTGTSTAFLTTLCPAGAGVCGTISETGTVTMTNASATITKTAGGTTWANNTGVDGLRIRIDDGSGNLYMGTIDVTGTNVATGSKTWTGTTGSYTYHILRSDRAYLGLEWDDPNLPASPAAPNGNTMPWRLMGCTSNTVCYITERLEAFGTGAVSEKRYTWQDYVWLNGNAGIGPNYYDNTLGHYALHFRSGLSSPLNAARQMGRYWAKNPELMGGRIGTFPRTFAPDGMYVAAVADGQTEDWPILRQKTTSNWDTSPCNQDLREVAYSQSFNSLSALFDPDNTLRAAHKVELGKVYTQVNACKGADNSFPTSYTSDQSGVDLTATNGSRDVTGTSIPSGLCGTTSVSTNGSVTNGSAALTGTGFVSGSYVAVAGTRSGSPWIQFQQAFLVTSTSLTMGRPWQGDTCTDCKVYIFSDTNGYVVGGMYDRTKYVYPGTVDQLLAEPYPNNACEWINSSLIRLAVPFTGPTGSTYRYGKYNLLGNGTQVYMSGIKANALKYASKIDDATMASNFTALLRLVAQWILNTGVDDPNDGVNLAGIFYARGFDDCEPATIGSYHPYFCAPDPSLNPEVFAALIAAYEADNSLQAKIDRLYGSSFGKPGWTTGGVYTAPVDLTFPANENFGSVQYYGRFFGMGFAHQWPAARLGGVAAPQVRNLSITLTLPAWAADVRVTVTQPSGATTTAVCSAFPCTLNAAGDARQGEEHPVTLEYRNGSGVVLRTGRGIARVQ